MRLCSHNIFFPMGVWTCEGRMPHSLAFSALQRQSCPASPPYSVLESDVLLLTSTVRGQSRVLGTVHSSMEAASSPLLPAMRPRARVIIGLATPFRLAIPLGLSPPSADLSYSRWL